MYLDPDQTPSLSPALPPCIQQVEGCLDGVEGLHTAVGTVYTLGMGCMQGSWSRAQQDTQDLTHILKMYYRHLADTREGEDSGRINNYLLIFSPLRNIRDDGELSRSAVQKDSSEMLGQAKFA